MHYYQHHIGDFIKATARLTDSQSMAYLRMIWAYYDNERPFPNDIDAIAFRVGAASDLVAQLVKCFFEVDGEFIRHRRCDEEIAGYHAKQEGGKKGAAKRWANKDSDRLPMANPMPEQSRPNTNHKPITNNQEPPIKTKAPAFVLPDWLPRDAWLDYVEMRKRIRKPMTAKAMALAVAELDKLRQQGHFPLTVIQQSIMNSWAGLFPLKDNVGRLTRLPTPENFDAVDYGEIRDI